MKAIDEARAMRAELAARLAKELEEFTAHTGLSVSTIDVQRIATTNMSDTHPRYNYAVDIVIEF